MVAAVTPHQTVSGRVVADVAHDSPERAAFKDAVGVNGFRCRGVSVLALHGQPYTGGAVHHAQRAAGRNRPRLAGSGGICRHVKRGIAARGDRVAVAELERQARVFGAEPYLHHVVQRHPALPDIAVGCGVRRGNGNGILRADAQRVAQIVEPNNGVSLAVLVQHVQQLHTRVRQNTAGLAVAAEHEVRRANGAVVAICSRPDANGGLVRIRRLEDIQRGAVRLPAGGGLSRVNRDRIFDGACARSADLHRDAVLIGTGLVERDLRVAVLQPIGLVDQNRLLRAFIGVLDVQVIVTRHTLLLGHRVGGGIGDAALVFQGRSRDLRSPTGCVLRLGRVIVDHGVDLKVARKDVFAVRRAGERGAYTGDRLVGLGAGGIGQAVLDRELAVDRHLLLIHRLVAGSILGVDAQDILAALDFVRVLRCDAERRFVRIGNIRPAIRCVNGDRLCVRRRHKLVLDLADAGVVAHRNGNRNVFRAVAGQSPKRHSRGDQIVCAGNGVCPVGVIHAVIVAVPVGVIAALCHEGNVSIIHLVDKRGVPADDLDLRDVGGRRQHILDESAATGFIRNLICQRGRKAGARIGLVNAVLVAAKARRGAHNLDSFACQSSSLRIALNLRSAVAPILVRTNVIVVLRVIVRPVRRLLRNGVEVEAVILVRLKFRRTHPLHRRVRIRRSIRGGVIEVRAVPVCRFRRKGTRRAAVIRRVGGELRFNGLIIDHSLHVGLICGRPIGRLCLQLGIDDAIIRLRRIGRNRIARRDLGVDAAAQRVAVGINVVPVDHDGGTVLVLDFIAVLIIGLELVANFVVVHQLVCDAVIRIRRKLRYDLCCGIAIVAVRNVIRVGIVLIIGLPRRLCDLAASIASGVVLTAFNRRAALPLAERLVLRYTVLIAAVIGRPTSRLLLNQRLIIIGAALNKVRRILFRRADVLCAAVGIRVTDVNARCACRIHGIRRNRRVSVVLTRLELGDAAHRLDRHIRAVFHLRVVRRVGAAFVDLVLFPAVVFAVRNRNVPAVGQLFPRTVSSLLIRTPARGFCRQQRVCRLVVRVLFPLGILNAPANVGEGAVVVLIIISVVRRRPVARLSGQKLKHIVESDSQGTRQSAEVTCGIVLIARFPVLDQLPRGIPGHVRGEYQQMPVAFLAHALDGHTGRDSLEAIGCSVQDDLGILARSEGEALHLFEVVGDKPLADLLGGILSIDPDVVRNAAGISAALRRVVNVEHAGAVLCHCDDVVGLINMDLRLGVVHLQLRPRHGGVVVALLFADELAHRIAHIVGKDVVGRVAVCIRAVGFPVVGLVILGGRALQLSRLVPLRVLDEHTLDLKIIAVARDVCHSAIRHADGEKELSGAQAGLVAGAQTVVQLQIEILRSIAGGNRPAAAVALELAQLHDLGEVQRDVELVAIVQRQAGENIRLHRVGGSGIGRRHRVNDETKARTVAVAGGKGVAHVGFRDVVQLHRAAQHVALFVVAFAQRTAGIVHDQPVDVAVFIIGNTLLISVGGFILKIGDVIHAAFLIGNQLAAELQRVARQIVERSEHNAVDQVQAVAGADQTRPVAVAGDGVVAVVVALAGVPLVVQRRNAALQNVQARIVGIGNGPALNIAAIQNIGACQLHVNRLALMVIARALGVLEQHALAQLDKQVVIVGIGNLCAAEGADDHVALAGVA